MITITGSLLARSLNSIKIVHFDIFATERCPDFIVEVDHPTPGPEHNLSKGEIIMIFYPLCPELDDSYTTAEDLNEQITTFITNVAATNAEFLPSSSITVTDSHGTVTMHQP